MKTKKNSAFTLVELIVVITILAILGAIAFISLQGYSTQARDSTRISDLSSMKTSLELFQLDAGKYPLPTDSFSVVYSGSEVWYQGTFGESTFKNVENLDKIPTDPLDDRKYAYSVTRTKQEYQLSGVMEGDDLVFVGVNAGDKEAIAVVTGNYNGNVLKTLSGTTCEILSLPSIISSQDETTTELTTILAAEGLVYNGKNNLPSNFRSSKYNADGGFAFTSNKLVSYTDNQECIPLYDGENNTPRTTLLTNLQTAYSGTILANENGIKNIVNIDLNDINAVNIFGNAIVNNNLGGNIVASETIPNSCDNTTKPTDDLNKIYTVSPTNINQAYIQDSIECGYTCTGGYTGVNCEIVAPLITSTDCTNAGWLRVTPANDVYIGSSQSTTGFCISPRFSDWSDSDDGAGSISWNGWGNKSDAFRQGWDASGIRDSSNVNYTHGQTRFLNSEVTYDCKPLGTASEDYYSIDDISGRMKWLTSSGNTYIETRSIDWITGLIPHTLGTNPQAIPSIYIADCIDGTRDLGTTMTYIHNDNNPEVITYGDYTADKTTSDQSGTYPGCNTTATDSADLDCKIYQDRQKYLTAWTQDSGSHLPSAFSYITSGGSGGCPSGACNNLTGSARGEYQIACDLGLDINSEGTDDFHNENLWLAAIGEPNGIYRGRYARIVGISGCGNQSYEATSTRASGNSVRFIVRP